MSQSLQDALVIASARLDVAASEAVAVSGDGSQNIGAVEQGLR